ncbi:hypothetical protein [Roseibium sp.]|uniref:hypothetical protein n=1 Tax=Roseibium sp. TaxID=1936156 RepID=UPI003A97DFAF
MIQNRGSSHWLPSKSAFAAVLVLSTMAATPALAQDDDPTAAENKRYALVKSGDEILRIDRQAGSVSFCRKTNDIWRCMPAPLAEEAYQAEIAALADEVQRLKSELGALRQAPADGKDPAKPEAEAESTVSPDVQTKGSVNQEPENGAATSPEKRTTDQAAPDSTDDLQTRSRSGDAQGTDTGSGPDSAEAPVGQTIPDAVEREKQEDLAELPGPKADGDDDAALTEEDEQKLEQMLEFSERAMRRFFGLMKDLKEEMDRVEGK